MPGRTPVLPPATTVIEDITSRVHRLTFLTLCLSVPCVVGITTLVADEWCVEWLYGMFVLVVSVGVVLFLVLCIWQLSLALSLPGQSLLNVYRLLRAPNALRATYRGIRESGRSYLRLFSRLSYAANVSVACTTVREGRSCVGTVYCFSSIFRFARMLLLVF